MSRRACVPVPPGSSSLRTLNPALRPHAQRFIRLLQSVGIKVRVTSTRRSLDTQRALYSNWQHGCSRLPAAAPGKSRHGTGTAFDLHLDPPEYKGAGIVWEAMGGTWGGRFDDPVHFDVR